MTGGAAHVTVLLEEAVGALAIQADGIYMMPPSGGVAIAAEFLPISVKRAAW